MATNKWRAPTLLLMAIALAGVGCRKESVAAGSQHEAWFAAIDKADKEQNALTRCISYPPPPGYDWPSDLLEALCADSRAPVAQAAKVREFIDRADWPGLHAHYANYLKRHHAGDDPELLLYRAFPISSWNSEAEADAYTERWLAAVPNDPYASTLRAKFRLQQAWTLRGWQYAEGVPRERMQQVVQWAGEATGLVQRAIAREPGLMPAYQILEEASALTGDHEGLATALQVAIRQSPQTYYVRQTALGFLQPQWGGTEEQRNQLVHEAAASARGNPRLALLRVQLAGLAGDKYSSRRQFGPALDAYRQALAPGPYHDTLEAAAVAARETGHHAEAVMYWSQVLRFTRDPVRALTNRGIAWEAITELPRALRDYAAAAEIDRKDADLPYRMALIEHKRQSFEAAEQHYLNALRLAPDHEGALRSACRLWVHLKQDPRKAKPYAERLTRLTPDDPEAWLLLANVYHGLGDPAARGAAQRFLKIAPPDDPQWKDPISHVSSFLEE